MSTSVWLVNLFGTPCSPTAFNPDNSLAALAGSLKRAGFQPLILDYQTLSMFRALVPDDLGARAHEIATLAQAKTLSAEDFETIRSFNGQVLRHQLSVVNSLAGELIDRAQREKPLFIGLKLFSGEGTLFNRHLAERLRSALNIPIVGGGPVVRILGTRYLELYREFDFIMSGECDNSIVSFARYCQGELAPSEVKGLIYRGENGQVIQNPSDFIEDMASLPDPCYDRDVYPALYEPGEKIMSFQLDESRGCPNSCHFCVHPNLNGRGIRMAPAAKIVGQIKSLQKTFGAYGFRFAGSNPPKRFLREFAQEVLNQKLNIMYSCFASINTTDVSMIKPLRESGLAGVLIGAESLDAQVLSRSFNKRGQPKEKVEQTVKAFIDAGVFTVTSWIYPAPFSTIESREEIKSFIIDAYGGRSSDAGSAIIIPPAVVPSTAWHQRPADFGFEITNDESFYRGYAELSFKLYLPAQLMGEWNFRLNGRSFTDLGAESDRLREELAQAGVNLGVTDDWMLIGKLSGMSMAEFRQSISHCFITGDADKLSAIIKQVNENSRRHVAGTQKTAA